MEVPPVLHFIRMFNEINHPASRVVRTFPIYFPFFPHRNPWFFPHIFLIFPIHVTCVFLWLSTMLICSHDFPHDCHFFHIFPYVHVTILSFFPDVHTKISMSWRKLGPSNPWVLAIACATQSCICAPRAGCVWQCRRSEEQSLCIFFFKMGSTRLKNKISWDISVYSGLYYLIWAIWA